MLMQKNKKYFKKGLGLLIKRSIFAPALGKDLIAQLVEHNTFNVRVLGSSPSQVTESELLLARFFCLFN